MKSEQKTKRTTIIKTRAYELGFDFCGISKAEKLAWEEDRLAQWLSRNYHGQMEYMENHLEKRLDPCQLVPGAKSVISLALNYYPREQLEEVSNYKVSKYAYGKDYHGVIKKKLKKLLNTLRDEIGAIAGRAFVDSAPVMERQWAAKAGVGWIGKNGLLLNRNLGSFFFLAELITDLDLEYDLPVADHCGTCTRCLDACPTNAFPRPGVLDASRCISYLTIELRDRIPETFKGKMENWIFGCDICQDVCPWNRFSRPHRVPAFQPSEKLQAMRKEDWEEITSEVFSDLFKGSAIQRTKYEGLKRNIQFIKNPA